MDATYLAVRIAKIEAIIEAIEDAILALASGTQQSYTLDTGQTRQTVTQKDTVDLQKSLNGYYNLYEILCNRRDGGGTLRVNPGW